MDNPANPDAQPSLITRHSPADTARRAHLRVLVAEDDVFNQRVAVRLLETLGCRTDIVANGREAVEVLSRIPYDLVLMDSQMPEMDGFEATRAIREREASLVKREAPTNCEAREEREAHLVSREAQDEIGFTNHERRFTGCAPRPDYRPVR